MAAVTPDPLRLLPKRTSGGASPLPNVGEGGPSRRRGPGEGFCSDAFASYPSPGSSLAHARNEPPSPTRGEGKRVCRSVSQQSHKGGGVQENSQRQRAA